MKLQLFDTSHLSHFDWTKLKMPLNEDLRNLVVFSVTFPVVVAGLVYLLERLLTD